MKQKKVIVHLVGARPNFVKIAPLLRTYKNYPYLDPILIHTGQHFDENLSERFFEDLEIQKPDFNLGINRTTVIGQIGRTIIKLEDLLKKISPSLVVVVGDANPSIAGAMAAKYLQIPIAHIEAGLRSRDHSMPEEINRIITDRISDILFVTETSAKENLLNEGVKIKNIHFVGNIMIDSLKTNLSLIKKLPTPLIGKTYCVVTLHRPSNVDRKENLLKMLGIFHQIYLMGITIVFPLHPRTRKFLIKYSLYKNYKKICNITKPLGYLEFLKYILGSKFVLTDSGGIQEEASWLKIPCLTIRENTERPVTIELGTNTLVGPDQKAILDNVTKILAGTYKKAKRIPYWDGNTSKRIIKVIDKYLSK